MADVRHAQNLEVISQDEADLLRVRLAEEDRRELTTLHEVAEATGVSMDEVRAHLSRMRAEQAFREAPKRRLQWVALAGVVSLVIGGTILWARTRPEPSTFSPLIFTGPAPTTRTITNRPLPKVTNLGGYSWGGKYGVPPPGFTIEMIGQRAMVDMYSSIQDVPRMAYLVERDQMVRSLEAISRRLSVQDSRAPSTIVGPYRHRTGQTVNPLPGKAHFSIQSWIGETNGQLTTPVTSTTRAELVRAATEALAEAKSAQDKALDVNVDPSQGTLSPPPGFSVEYSARRSDSQKGPTWAFDTLSSDQVVRRLGLAIKNAIVRDALPPSGRWTGKPFTGTKAPKEAHVEVEGPGGKFAFDISPNASLAEIERKLAPAGRQIEEANAKVLKTPTDGPPTENDRD